MKKIYIYLILMLFVTSTLQSASSDYRILLQSGAITSPPNIENFISDQSPLPNELFNGYYYRFMQFNTIPNSIQRKDIAASGIQLLEYIPRNTYMVAIPVTIDKTVLRSLNVRCVISQQSTQKIGRNLLGGVPEYAVVEKGTGDVVVQYQKNMTIEQAQLAASKFGSVISITNTNHSLVLRVTPDKVEVLAEQPWVFFMDAISQQSTPDDTKGRSLHRSNSINSSYATGLHYDGAGVVIGLADDGEIGPHIDFTGRFTDHVGTGAGGGHGDMTSGIAVGAGNLNPVIRGMATGAQLEVYDITGYPHIINAVSNYNTLGTVITSTSYSQGCNDYTTATEFGDQTIHDNPQLQFVFSAGNFGAGNCNYGAGSGWGTITGGYKQGKNVIACGNLDPLDVLDNSSSRGPASDGRIKPDICANGLDQMSTDEGNTYQVGGGTSAACPGIAGISAQLYHAYKDLNGGVNPESPLIKACMLNSAEDIGNPGPDYTYGWGRVNARRAFTTLQDVRYLLDSAEQGISKTHTISVPANVRQMRVMLYWLDPAGSPVSTQYLVNDLNLQVIDPISLLPINPWVLDPTPVAASLSANAVRGIDSLNNMEQVTIDFPTAGNYDVTVNGFAVPQGPQRYYIVYEFRTDEIIVTYPNGGEGFVPGEQEVIRWDAPKGVNSFTLSYSTDNGTTWTPIGTASSTTLQYNWIVPTTITTGDALIRVDNGTTNDISDTVFTVIRTPQNITVDWACPATTHLIWTAVPGAIGYEVYQLGAKYMDPIGISSTNQFFVAGTNPNSEYWFSVSAIAANGMKGRRAIAINKQPGVFSCPVAFDAQVTSVVNPQSGSLQTCQDINNVPVSILIENKGQNPLINVPIGYSLDGGAAVNETYVGTIAPFTSITYVFTATANLATIGMHAINTWTAYSGDLNANNDSATTFINVVSGSMAAIPFVETFDIFSLCSTASDCEATICALPNDWINEESGLADDIDFRTNSGATPSAGTGPNFDHTTNNATGRYMYLEASGNCFGKTALLTSPCIDLSLLSTPVLSFWYHMFGSDMGSLHVDIYDGENWTLDIIAPINGDQGNNWLQMLIPLNSFLGEIVNVRFRGITGSEFASDLAIDDINIDNALGLSDQQFEGNIQVYPNPSNGLFNILMNDIKNERMSLQLYNIEGSLLQQNNLEVVSSYKSILDMRSYAKGIYFLEIRSNSGIKRFKLTVI